MSAGITKCGKRAYPGQAEAKREAKQIRYRSGMPFRAYPCPDCKDWHISKTPPRNGKIGGNKKRKRGRRPVRGQTFEELAKKMREERVGGEV